VSLSNYVEINLPVECNPTRTASGDTRERGKGGGIDGLQLFPAKATPDSLGGHYHITRRNVQHLTQA
jgi:hypothetical protein